MSCLLPQFKCQPDIFCVQFKFHPHYHSTINGNPTKHKDTIYFRPYCILSSGSTSTTAVLDVEKLRLPSFETHSNSVPADRPLTYVGATGPPTEANLKAALASESLFNSDEAVIAAAAAEALALARAAVKVAKDAVLMFNDHDAPKMELKSTPLSDASTSKLNQFTEAEWAGIVGDSPNINFGQKKDDHSSQVLVEESEDQDPTSEELELLEEQFSHNIAVKSNRQTERKAKRAKAKEKVSSSVLRFNSGTASRKKRALPEIDYNDPLRFIRGATSSSKLLTASEELKLSEGIQDLLKLERLQEELTERCGGEPTFAQWAAAAGVDKKTLRRRLTHGTICKDKMIKSNIRLVISIAKNYQGAGLNIQDLVQEGCRGLVKGAEKFDASKGFKFSTYAHWWIRQSVRRSLSDQSRTIRLPLHMVEAAYRVKEARKQLYIENGKHPENEEVAVAAGLSMKRLNAVLLTPKAPRSLDQKIGINQNLKPSEVIADPEAQTAEAILIREFMKKDLEKVLNTLNAREKQVIKWRFGMDDGRMKTLQEIGEPMGVSRERIRQIELCAFRKLQNKKRTRHLQQYLLSC